MNLLNLLSNSILLINIRNILLIMIRKKERNVEHLLGVIVFYIRQVKELIRMLFK